MPMLLAEATGTGFSTVVTDVMEVVSTMMTTIQSNAVLFTFFACGIIPIAIGIVHRLKQ